MDFAEVAKAAVKAQTGETVNSVKEVSHDKPFIDYRVITVEGATFTVTVNTALKLPAGHLFEGIDPKCAQLFNFHTDEAGVAYVE